jgi:hypothetical protein
MPRKKAKKVKVIWRPLGKERAWGQATTDPAHPVIEIDPRLSPQRELETLTHESLHLAFPEMSEKEVDRAGKVVSSVLWQENYRRVLQGKHTTPVRIS